MSDLQNALTIVIPTRNRSELCGSLVRFLRKCGLSCPILVTDSSDPDHARKNQEACHATASDYHHYGPDVAFYDKLIDSLNRVKSPFVVLLPDDDIPLPHALEECATFLSGHDDYAAAWGYVADYALHEGQLDIFRVHWFTPSIDDATAFERVYHLVRRYQPFFWAVFRAEALAQSLNEARDAGRVVFQELTMTLTAAMQGKIARLPVIYSLRGAEPSSYDRAKVEPLFGFIDDAASFIGEYAGYRDRMASFARRHLGDGAESQLCNCTIEQFLDLVHGIGLARELDPGPLNYTVQRALGAPLPQIPVQQDWPGWRDPSGGDAVHASAIAGRRYIWRQDVLEAEPRSEIMISHDEIARVERQIENYVI